MAQEWNMRHVLVDKQGNFGSIAGLPPAAMRYTEARLSPIAALMLEDLKLDTVDFIPTYDERRTGADGAAVEVPQPAGQRGQRHRGGHGHLDPAAQPGRNLRRPDPRDRRARTSRSTSCWRSCPGPTSPPAAWSAAARGIRRGYHTGRGTIVIRARTRIEEHGKNRFRIVVSEIPFQQARDRVEERIAALVNEGKIAGISAIRNESDLKEPVRLILELKRDADPEIVLNQLYQFSPLQDTLLADLPGAGGRQAAGAVASRSCWRSSSATARR